MHKLDGVWLPTAALSIIRNARVVCHPGSEVKSVMIFGMKVFYDFICENITARTGNYGKIRRIEVFHVYLLHTILNK